MTLHTKIFCWFVTSNNWIKRNYILYTVFYTNEITRDFNSLKKVTSLKDVLPIAKEVQYHALIHQASF
jgi:hypothetical protein